MYNRYKTVVPFVKRKPYADVVYLTFVDDPLTTMTVQWHTIETNVGENPNREILYRKENTINWSSAVGTFKEMPFPNKVLEKKRLVHWTTIRGLNPETGYEFKFAGDKSNKIYKFKTMPANLDEKPLKLAFASDIHYGVSDVKDMSHDNQKLITAEIQKAEPDIMVGGGDLLYDDGHHHEGITSNWVRFLKFMQKHLINKEGYIIPFISSFGNHDGGYGFYDYADNEPHNPEEDDINWMTLFAFPTAQNHAYASLELGDYLQLLCLENGYAQPIEECTDWMVDRIDATKRHVLPFYHIPLYTYRGNRVDNHEKAIEQWVEPFQNAGVKVALNGHLHSYYYTKPLLNGEVVSGNEGIVYCGNGGWSFNRESWGFSEPVPEWIEKQAHGDYNERNSIHFYYLELTNDDIKVDSINKYGDTFDSFTRSV